MKKSTLLFTILFFVGLTSSHAQNTWAKKANFEGTARYGATGFGIGSKGYSGIGFDENQTYRKDWWEYDVNANTWTQKANFGGGGLPGGLYSIQVTNQTGTHEVRPL